MLNRIKEERSKQGIGQLELAARVDVSRQTIHSIETARFIPSTLLALKLARELGSTVEQLFLLEESD